MNREQENPVPPGDFLDQDRPPGASTTPHSDIGQRSQPHDQQDMSSSLPAQANHARRIRPIPRSNHLQHALRPQLPHNPLPQAQPLLNLARRLPPLVPQHQRLAHLDDVQEPPPRRAPAPDVRKLLLRLGGEALARRQDGQGRVVHARRHGRAGGRAVRVRAGGEVGELVAGRRRGCGLGGAPLRLVGGGGRVGGVGVGVDGAHRAELGGEGGVGGVVVDGCLVFATLAARMGNCGGRAGGRVLVMWLVGMGRHLHLWSRWLAAAGEL